MVKSKFFNMGQILITRGISETVGESERFAAEVVLALHRFAVKDWGDLDAEDIKANEEELNNPDDLYLLAAYRTSKGRILDRHKSYFRESRRQCNYYSFSI